MKGVVVKDPATGEPIRLMPGSLSLELYELAKGSNGMKGTKQKPSHADKYISHMRELHVKYKKEIGVK